MIFVLFHDFWRIAWEIFIKVLYKMGDARKRTKVGPFLLLFHWNIFGGGGGCDHFFFRVNRHDQGLPGFYHTQTFSG